MIRPGKNIAIKVPLHRYAETVAFYRDRVGLPVAREMENSTGFEFNGFTLWIDKVPHQSQVDVWLGPVYKVAVRKQRRMAARWSTSRNELASLS
jgi:extradiol dioxygenase family protein